MLSDLKENPHVGELPHDAFPWALIEAHAPWKIAHCRPLLRIKGGQRTLANALGLHKHKLRLTLPHP